MNRVKILTFLMCISLLFTGITLKAQDATKSESNFSFDIGADLVSRYVWRGTQFGGNSPSIQPGASVAWKGLEVGFWGAYSVSGLNNTQELDLYLSYTFLNDMISLGITDYFFPNDQLPYKMFEYGRDSTGHILEGSFSFNGSDKIPVSLLIAMNIYGADAAKINDDPNGTDFNIEDGIQYSTYMELGYATNIGNLSFDAFAGVNLTAPRKEDINTGYLGETGFYGSKAGLVNIGFTLGKELPITSMYALPITASLITNPVDNRYYFVFGFSF